VGIFSSSIGGLKGAVNDGAVSKMESVVNCPNNRSKTYQCLRWTKFDMHILTHDPLICGDDD